MSTDNSQVGVAICPLLLLSGAGRIGCNWINFLDNRGWISRDVSMAGMCDFIKECLSFIK